MPRTVKEIMEQAEELARRFEDSELDTDTHDREGSAALAAVHRAALRKAEAESAIKEAVSRARTYGKSWDAIGRRLGTTGEAARQRYSQPSHH